MTETNCRRLPVYLLLDCSGSMTGEPIEAVRQGIKALVSDLRADPQALETAYLSIITFNSSAYQTPLEDLASFVEPSIVASGSTALGDALRVLNRSIDTDLRRGSETQRGDYRPVVFLLTDGQPTDDWERHADELKSRKTANVIALACGAGAQLDPLRRITETVLQMKDLQPEQLAAFFKWVSASIKVASVKVNGGPAQLPNLPPGLNVVS